MKWNKKYNKILPRYLIKLSANMSILETIILFEVIYFTYYMISN